LTTYNNNVTVARDSSGGPKDMFELLSIH
jgi:hypothetical protein